MNVITHKNSSCREREMRPLKAVVWWSSRIGRAVSLFDLLTVQVREVMPLKISRSLFQEPVNVTSEGEMDFAELITLRMLTWGDYLGLMLSPET